MRWVIPAILLSFLLACEPGPLENHTSSGGGGSRPFLPTYITCDDLEAIIGDPGAYVGRWGSYPAEVWARASATYAARCSGDGEGLSLDSESVRLQRDDAWKATL